MFLSRVNPCISQYGRIFVLAQVVTKIFLHQLWLVGLSLAPLLSTDRLSSPRDSPIDVSKGNIVSEQ